MAVAARVNQRSSGAAIPRLRVFLGGKGRAPSRPRKAVRSAAACRHLFMIGCGFLAVLAILGMGRVALTVKATEAAVLASSLAADIEAERIAIEQLESSRSVLVAPNRIRNLAENTMRMGIATEVDYMEISPAATVGPDGVRHNASAAEKRDDRVARILTGIMHMTAGEAQVLLVGDAGLISSR